MGPLIVAHRALTLPRPCYDLYDFAFSDETLWPADFPDSIDSCCSAYLLDVAS